MSGYLSLSGARDCGPVSSLLSNWRSYSCDGLFSCVQPRATSVPLYGSDFASIFRKLAEEVLLCSIGKNVVAIDRV